MISDIIFLLLLYTVVLFYNPIGQQLWNKSQYSTLEHDNIPQFLQVDNNFYKWTTIKSLCSNHYCHSQAILEEMQLQQIMLGEAEGGVCIATCHFVERRFEQRYSESGVIV